MGDFTQVKSTTQLKMKYLGILFGIILVSTVVDMTYAEEAANKGGNKVAEGSDVPDGSAGGAKKVAEGSAGGKKAADGAKKAKEAATAPKEAKAANVPSKN